MRLILASVALVVSSSAQAAADPQRFDLKCSGVYSAGPGKGEAWTQNYHISLVDGYFCEGDCKKTQPLVAVTSDKIVLMQINLMGLNILRYVDRGTGQLIHRAQYGYTGDCEALPYSGPKALRKF